MTTHRRQLDEYYAQARGIILARQNPHTGLLPASTAVTVHGDYTHAWVRDNVYSILAIWALHLAYREQEPARAAELGASVEKLMRGLLHAMMRQAHKVERFKYTQNPLDALHAKYDTERGEPVVGDDAWGHLQLDATAIFLLTLAQMTASGLHIVHTPDEVCFVQNLVYYLGKAYRTPDYGIWERGHKRNEGVAEVNASSVGMAKAALESMQGFDPLPGQAPRIHVLADDIAHARNTLEGLLPRESESKETDAALLSIIGYPAFAVDDPALLTRTRDDIVAKLGGRYGCKRFLRDGHQTVLEDHSRLHYEPGELAQFEHIESEWPLFFTYLLLDAVLRSDDAAAADYRRKLDDLLQTRDGQQLLPELYYVPAELVALEKAEPHSQPRLPNENVPLVWAQSLYIVGVLLQEGHIQLADIDPLGRRLRPTQQPAVTVQVAILAEDDIAQARLRAHGVEAQAQHQVLPVQIRHAEALDGLLHELGRHDGMGLSGCPTHRIGSLTTSQVFSAGDDTLLFLPPFLNRLDFYLGLDNRLLTERIKGEIAYLQRHWRQDGQPLLVLQFTEAMLGAAGADVLLAYLAELQSGAVAQVHADTLAQVLPLAGTDVLDWGVALPAQTPVAANRYALLAMLNWEEAATRRLSADKAAAIQREGDADALARLARSRNPYEQIELLEMFWRRHGEHFHTGEHGNVRQLTGLIYARARRERMWGVVRRAAGLLDVWDDTLEEAVGQIVVHQKRISVGRAYSSESVIAKPLGNEQIVALIRSYGGDDTRGRVLIQEIVLLLGMLIKADPALFKGTLTLRAWHLLLLVTGWLAREHGVTQAEAFDYLLDLSPHAILGRLREVIASEQEMVSNLVNLQTLHSANGSNLVIVSFPASGDPLLESSEAGRGGDWATWRETTGVLTRVPEDFYVRIWALLQAGPGLVIGDQLDTRNRLESNLARADMTAAEKSFAILVEDLLNKIQAAPYRQLTIEALLALASIFEANPRLRVNDYLVLDVLIGFAVRLAWIAKNPALQAQYNEHRAQAWQDFYASPPHHVANQVMAAVAYLLEQNADGELVADEEAAATQETLPVATDRK